VGSTEPQLHTEELRGRQNKNNTHQHTMWGWAANVHLRSTIRAHLIKDRKNIGIVKAKD
jgi:hypothetical protein